MNAVELCYTGGTEEDIIRAARMSTGGTFRGWEREMRLLAYLYNNAHMTPFEMCTATFEVKTPIFIAREFMRHRTLSFNEHSARYSALTVECYLPTVHRVLSGIEDSGHNKQAAGTGRQPTAGEVGAWLSDAQELYDRQAEIYADALRIGIPRELARVTMPVAQYTRFRASGNLRNWLQFLKLRLDVSAQLEIRELANLIHDQLSDKFPHTLSLFDESRQTVLDRA